MFYIILPLYKLPLTGIDFSSNLITAQWVIFVQLLTTKQKTTKRFVSSYLCAYQGHNIDLS